MKLRLSLVLVLFSGLLFAPRMLAQDSPANSADTTAELRARLVEVQASEADLQTRLRQLEENLKPGNIEHSLAGVGSTRPEELRELRRKELSIQRDGVLKQLDLLATSRARLESAIQRADNRAYQQSAQGFAVNQIGANRRYSLNLRWILIPGITIVGLLVIGCLFAYLLRRR